jgi:hypothetical protein
MDLWSPDEIQSRYFRAGTKTFLWLDYDQKTALLSWSFTFLDFGMHHMLSGQAIVSSLQGTPAGFYSVNGTIHPSRDAAMHAVFGNHYTEFMAQLYADLGVKNTCVRSRDHC